MNTRVGIHPTNEPGLQLDGSNLHIVVRKVALTNLGRITPK